MLLILFFILLPLKLYASETDRYPSNGQLLGSLLLSLALVLVLIELGTLGAARLRIVLQLGIGHLRVMNMPNCGLIAAMWQLLRSC